MTPPLTPHARTLSHWLIIAAASILIMTVIGAITRLTESGLSMVEWKPLIGVLPPLSDAEWLRVFTLYQQSPEYQLKNMGMSLGEFKNIFFWEWLHRTWGHVIGLIYALPLVYFTARGMVTRALLPRLLFIFALGGLQGVIGWYMVASGLVDKPDVSHFRLALHLGTALLIYALTVWTICDLRQGRGATTFCRWRHGWVALLFLSITIVYGAFVAGLDAGLAYNTWPLMNGHVLPPEVNVLPTWHENMLHNTAAVQFIHRWLAVATAFLVITFAWRVRAAMPLLSWWLGVAVIAQVLLGIITLLSVVWLPIAALHQLGAVATLTLLLMAMHRNGRFVQGN